MGHQEISQAIDSQKNLSPETQRDLSGAIALTQDLHETSANEKIDLSLENASLERLSPVELSIDTTDLATFVRNVIAAQEQFDVDKITTRIMNDSKVLGREEVTSYKADSVYRNLQSWGLEIDLEVFNREVERINARQRVLNDLQQKAIALGLPQEASLQDIAIETRIRKQVDCFLPTISKSIRDAIQDPDIVKDGKIPLRFTSLEEQIRLKPDHHQAIFSLGNWSEISASIEHGTLSSIHLFIARLVITPQDFSSLDAVNIKSPALMELFERVKAEGGVPSWSFTTSEWLKDYKNGLEKRCCGSLSRAISRSAFVRDADVRICLTVSL